jgi:hypothetical protein
MGINSGIRLIFVKLYIMGTTTQVNTENNCTILLFINLGVW